MRVAVIDIGTNTFHLIVADLHGGNSQIVYKTNHPVKLGEDITKNNFIIPAAFERGLACLKVFQKTITAHKVDVVKAVATSGVRSAKNGHDFVEKAKLNSGIDIAIIDGDEEAQYIYEGVKWSGAISGKSLIMDIGGGSTEFILCDDEELIWKKSYDIGASRLMQAFFKSDPLLPSDQKSLLHHIGNELKALKVICEEFMPTTLIGSAGAFETYAEMISPGINLKQTATADLPLATYRDLAKRLIQSSHAEREGMEGLIPLRVDMIVMAAMLTNYVIDELSIQRLKLSTFDLKMGVLHSLSV